MTRLPRLSDERWADLLLDPGSVEALPAPDIVVDPLSWPGYPGRVRRAGRAVGGFTGSVDGHRCVLIATRFHALGGSMGAVFGARVRAAFAHATTARVPVISVTSTGGARMQEGMHSLVQMPGTVAAAVCHAAAGLLQIAVASDPTTGGVAASFVNHADLICAEAGAYVAFAGPRVAAVLGDGKPGPLENRAEGAFDAGLVDAVRPREALRDWLAEVLGACAPDEPGSSAAAPPRPEPPQAGRPLDAWAAVTAARHVARPRADTYLGLFDAFTPMSGDRCGGRDPGVRAGIGRLFGRRVGVVAVDRMPISPAGFRTVGRVADLAERLGCGLLTLVDTPGADPTPAANARGQAAAVSRTTARLLSLRVPFVALVTGEGGSGGGMALACGDRLLLQRTAFFSVIAPEAAAAILHRDPGRAAEVAPLLHLTARELVAAGIADAVVPDDPAAALALAARQLDEVADARPGARAARWRQIADAPLLAGRVSGS